MGTICLYGTRTAGFGWIASIRQADGASKMLGNGELTSSSMTAAIWTAADAVRQERNRGQVHIIAPGGEQSVMVEISRHIPSAGQLQWK